MNFSPAGMALGLNNLPGLGSALADQELQQRQLLGPGGSAAASSLFGSPFGGLGGFNGTGLLR
jgi:hypothetical protein